MDLINKRCIPCEGGEPPLLGHELDNYLKEVPLWHLADDKKSISREFKLRNFLESMKLVNDVARIAELQGHHPDIYIFFNKVRFELSTHAIGGLSENDFIIASQIDLLPLGIQ